MNTHPALAGSSSIPVPILSGFFASCLCCFYPFVGRIRRRPSLRVSFPSSFCTHTYLSKQFCLMSLLDRMVYGEHCRCYLPSSFTAEGSSVSVWFKQDVCMVKTFAAASSQIGYLYIWKMYDHRAFLLRHGTLCLLYYISSSFAKRLLQTSATLPGRRRLLQQQHSIAGGPAADVKRDSALLEE